ncbi:MAG: TolB family protein [Thermomicrobiales bacterium]
MSRLRADRQVAWMVRQGSANSVPAWSRRLLTGVLAATLATGGAPLASAPRVLAEARPYNTALLMTSNTGAAATGVATDGATVVWTDALGAIYARTLADGRETRLLDGPARRSQLVFANNTAVWVERDGSGVAIRGLKIGGTPFTIATGQGERNSPAIAGATVVWRDARDGAWNIYGYDLAAGREFPIATGGGKGAVAVAGLTVVWEDYRAGHWNLYGYDLKAQRDFAVTTGAADDTSPALNGSMVAFVRRQQNQSAGALVVRDLQSGQEQTITEGHLELRPAFADDLLVWEDWRDGVPNVYAYDLKSKQAFPVARTDEARAPAVGGTVVTWLSQAQFSSRVTAIRLVKPLPSDPEDPPTVTDPDVRYFSETKHSVSGAFRQYWNLHGGLDTFGYPLTEAFDETGADGVTRKVQYFERVKLEADPQDPKQVGLSRLGAELTVGRAFPTVAAFDSTDDRAYFPQTQHSLSGWFKDYWTQNGGVAVFGYPISEELNENGLHVQYFECARFELHADAKDPAYRVTLSQLGREALVKLGWIAPK